MSLKKQLEKDFPGYLIKDRGFYRKENVQGYFFSEIKSGYKGFITIIEDSAYILDDKVYQQLLKNYQNTLDLPIGVLSGSKTDTINIKLDKFSKIDIGSSSDVAEEEMSIDKIVKWLTKEGYSFTLSFNNNDHNREQ